MCELAGEIGCPVCKNIPLSGGVAPFPQRGACPQNPQPPSPSPIIYGSAPANGKRNRIGCNLDYRPSSNVRTATAAVAMQQCGCRMHGISARR